MPEHICPQCGCEEVSAIYYTCPGQADCKNCGCCYEYGEGIRIMGLAESMKYRPSMYKDHICEKCGKLTGLFGDLTELNDEDREVVCICKKEESILEGEDEGNKLFLLPCPFCGSEASIHKGGFGERFVKCNNEGCQAGLGASCWQTTDEEAQQAWNRRVK